MEDTQLYAILLGIKFPWRVNKVQVDMALSRIDVWVEEAPCELGHKKGWTNNVI